MREQPDHIITIKYVKTRQQWEGVCSCGKWSCEGPGTPTNGSDGVYRQAELHRNVQAINVQSAA